MATDQKLVSSVLEHDRSEMIFDIFNNENDELQNMRKAPITFVSVTDGISVVSDTGAELPTREVYDNAFYYGFDVVVLCKGGKWGAVGFDKDHQQCRLIANCDYDTLDERNHDLVFSKRGEQVYYNAATNRTLQTRSVHFCGNDGSYILADEKGEWYSLWEREIRNLLWRTSKNDVRVKSGLPVLMQLESFGGFPFFQDVTNGFYLAPSDYAVIDGELVVTRLMEIE